VPSIFPFKAKPVSRNTRVSLGLHRHVPNYEDTDETSLTSEGATSSLEISACCKYKAGAGDCCKNVVALLYCILDFSNLPLK